MEGPAEPGLPEVVATAQAVTAHKEEKAHRVRKVGWAGRPTAEAAPAEARASR